MTKKIAEKKGRFSRFRQVWEGGPVTCLCCNLPSQLVSSGAVLRAVTSSMVALPREEIGALVAPVLALALPRGRAGRRHVMCPRCERDRKISEQKMYFVRLDEDLQAGPMCLECVSDTVENTGSGRILDDVPVWIVKCGAAAIALMEHIDFSKLINAPREEPGPRSELLY